MERGEFDQAVEAFRIGERIDEISQSWVASYFRGEAERRRGNDEGALDAYIRVVEADGADREPVRSAAAKQARVIQLRRERYGEARALLILAANTEDFAERARCLLLLGTCERFLVNREAAIATFEQAAAIPSAPDDIRGLAQQALSELR